MSPIIRKEKKIKSLMIFFVQMQTKTDMYKRAADKHNTLMAEATDNRGNFMLFSLHQMITSFEQGQSIS